jgi:hypothetical protein
MRIEHKLRLVDAASGFTKRPSTVQMIFSCILDKAGAVVFAHVMRPAMHACSPLFSFRLYWLLIVNL